LLRNQALLKNASLNQELASFLGRGALNRFGHLSFVTTPLLPGAFLSGSAQARLIIQKSIISSGVAFGNNEALSGGTILNGEITGTIYGTNGANPIPYFNEGSYLNVFGNNPLNTGGFGGGTITLPNTPDFLTFKPNSSLPIGRALIPLIHGKPLFIPPSGATRALLNQYAALVRSSVALGVKTAPPLIGGQFVGSFFYPISPADPNSYFYSSKFLLAFGNNPLNTISTTYVTPNIVNYLEYAGKHGQVIIRVISGGQFFNTEYAANSPFYPAGTNLGGSFQGIGNNPFNTGPTSQIFDLTNQGSFINF